MTLAYAASIGLPSAHGQGAVEGWVQRYNGRGESDDHAKAIAKDSSGHVIVAGNSDSGFTDNDWVIFKYSGAGVALWTNRYDSPGNGDDQAVAVVVDGSGNVFVAGFSTGGSSGFSTIKYSGTGMPLWTNRYPGNDDDRLTGAAVDSAGNVFVTGTIDLDYVTIAYSGAGAPLWTNRYDAGYGFYDSAAAIAVDGSGKVFVTGESEDDGASYEFATVAYSGAGVPLWTNRYNGPDESHATAVAVDTNGNVFVTGASREAGGYAYATIAYSGQGVPLWTNRYKGLDYVAHDDTDDTPRALAVDSSGNVFVTGSSVVFASIEYDPESGYDYVYNADYVTIKYSGAGVALWTNRYNWAGHYDDKARAIALDSGGNVLVTGSSADGCCAWDYATIKYSNDGVPLWTNRYGAVNLSDEAAAVAVDNNGTVFVTGSSRGNGASVDYATLAYSSGGALLWTNRYNDAANAFDEAVAVAVDGSGNVFVAGSSLGGSGSAEYSILAYTSSGVPLWTNRYKGPNNGGAYVSGLALDGNGNVFVTGHSFEGGTWDYTTIKYSGAGVPLWTNRYDGGSFNFCVALAVDGSGNVFVTGYSEGAGGHDYVTIKYSGSGMPLWTNRYDTPPGSDSDSDSDSPTAMAVDSTGSVIVTGRAYKNGDEQYATIKYSGAGMPLWTNYHGRQPGDGTLHRPNAVAVDGGNNVFVTGRSAYRGGYGYATIKYSAAGLPLWTNRYVSANSQPTDEANAIAVDGSGSVIVTGRATVSAGSSDYVTIKYSGAGLPLWTNRYHGPGNGYDWASSLAVDGNGNVFVTGQSAGVGSGDDYATIKYSAAGVPLWTNRYNGPANGHESMIYDVFPHRQQSIALGPDGSVYVTGSSDADYSAVVTGDFATIKYVSSPTLMIRQVAGNVVISWPSTFSDFTLQQNTDAMATTNWSNVPGTVQDNGTSRSVTISPPTGQRFYRLSKP